MMNAIAVVLLLVASLSAAQAARAADQGGISLSEFARYRNQQALELHGEQASQAVLNEPKLAEKKKRQVRRFETERLRQLQLLEMQRRWLAAERGRLQPAAPAGSARSMLFQRLTREQASEALSRKLLR